MAESNAVALTTFLLILLTSEISSTPENYKLLTDKWQSLPSAHSPEAEAKALEKAQNCSTEKSHLQLKEIIKEIESGSNGGSNLAFALRVDVPANSVQEAIMAGIDVLDIQSERTENRIQMFTLPEEYWTCDREGYQSGYNVILVKQILQLAKSGGIAAVDRSPGLYVFFACFPLDAEKVLMFAQGKFEFRK